MRWACWTLRNIQIVINSNPLLTGFLHICSLVTEPDSIKAPGTEQGTRQMWPPSSWGFVSSAREAVNKEQMGKF